MSQGSLNKTTGKVKVEPAVATAAAPTLVEGSPVALSTDLTGALRVSSTGGGGAVTVADGADVAEGTTTDTAIVSDSNGTISGKLRGLVKIFASVWDSVNGRLKVDASAVTVPVSNAGLTNVDVALSTRLKPADTLAGVTTVGAVTGITNPVVVSQSVAANLNATVSGTVSVNTISNFANESGGNLASLNTKLPSQGQAAMAASTPVVIASNQSAVPVTATFPASATIGITALSDNDTVPFQRQPSVDIHGNLGVGGDELQEIRRTLHSMERILMAIHLTLSQSYTGSYIDPSEDVEEFLIQ